MLKITPAMLSVDEAAGLINGVSRKLIRQYIDDDKIPHIITGKAKKLIRNTDVYTAFGFDYELAPASAPAEAQ